MFFEPNNMVLMDTNWRYGRSLGHGAPMTRDDLLKLHDLGIRYITEYYTWATTEPTPRGYDWSECDELVERSTGAGMKCILMGPNGPPGWQVPYPWMTRKANGEYDGKILSFWNREAQAYQQEFYRTLVKRYSSSNCMIGMCEFLTGECCLDNQPCFYDDAAIASHQAIFGTRPDISTQNTQDWLAEQMIYHYLETQACLVDQHQEIWESLQWCIANQSRANGNFAQPRIQQACMQRWPEAHYVLLQYTYFAHGPAYFKFVQDMLKAGGSNMSLIVEAQYCDGLRDRATTEGAISHGAHGQIVAPMHPYTNIHVMEPWQFQVIGQAQAKWQATGG